MSTTIGTILNNTCCIAYITESQKTSARVKTRLNQMTLDGKFTGGVAPFGYKLIKSGEINKKGK